MQGEADPLSLTKEEPARGGRPVDGEGHRTRQDEDIGPAGRGKSPVDRVEQREHQAVLGSRGVLQLHLDLALAARHLPEQEVRRVPCPGRARGCRSPIANASTTTAVPVAVRYVVSNTMVRST